MRGKTIFAAIAILAAPLLMLSLAQGQDEQSHAQHIVVLPDKLEWKDGPPGLPPGAKIATLEGDMSKPEPFTVRAKTPAGYKIPPHWHPAIEHVTVLSGKLGMGAGDELDKSKGTVLPPGGFAVMPPKMHHFAWAEEECEIQIHGVGPWGITYVNDADDPRKK